MKNLKWGDKLVYTLTSAGARKYWAVEGGEPPVPVLGNSFTAVFNREMSEFPSYGFNDISEFFIKEPINSTTCKYKLPENRECIALTSTFDASVNYTSTYLTSIDFTDMDTTAIRYFNYAFYRATSLTTVVGLDVDGAIYGRGDLEGIFEKCTSLKNLDMKNIRISLDLYFSELERDAVVNIFNNLLPPTSSSYRPVMSLSPYSSSKITSADEQIAIDRGWNVYKYT